MIKVMVCKSKTTKTMFGTIIFIYSTISIWHITGQITRLQGNTYQTEYH